MKRLSNLRERCELTGADADDAELAVFGALGIRSDLADARVAENGCAQTAQQQRRHRILSAPLRLSPGVTSRDHIRAVLAQGKVE